MMRNMVTSLFKHEQLETTDAKAKELRQVAEKMITLAEVLINLVLGLGMYYLGARKSGKKKAVISA